MGIEALLTSQVIGLDAALSGKLSTSGGTVTGQLTNALGTITASTPLTISQTWNNAAVTFSALNVEITDTSSAAFCRLLDLKIGGLSRFYVSKSNVTNAETVYLYSNLGTASGRYITLQPSVDAGFGTANGMVSVSSSGCFKFSSGTTAEGTSDVELRREGTGTLAMRLGVNPNTFRLYNTWTSSTSFENLQLQWSSNEARIGTSVGSAGGTQRSLVLGAWNSAGTWTAGLTVGTNGQLTNALGTITSSTPATFTQTWNNVATSFTALLANVTDSASASGSLLMDLQVGGTSKFKVTKDGRTNSPFFGTLLADNTGSAWEFIGTGYRPKFNYAGVRLIELGNGSLVLKDASSLQWASGNISSNDGATTVDLLLYRDAARTLALRDGVNANVFNIYNTYTSSTSYERGKIAWESNVLKIGTEKGSAGGSARALELQTDGTTRLTVASTGGVTITDAINIAVGTTTGTKIGTGTTQKIGFWNATPVVQPTAVADATDAASVITQLNALLSRMRDLGLIAT